MFGQKLGVAGVGLGGARVFLEKLFVPQLLAVSAGVEGTVIGGRRRRQHGAEKTEENQAHNQPYIICSRRGC